MPGNHTRLITPVSTKNKKYIECWRRNAAVVLMTVVALSASLSACSPQPTAIAAQGPNIALTEAFDQALEQARQSFPTATPSPTATTPPPTPTATVTPVRTPPALPAAFTSSLLAKDVLPQAYIQDTCEYLKARWDPNNSVPGTVVMTIMYHSVTEDYNEILPDGSQVRHKDVVMALGHAHEVGFETITSNQLADFLDHNAKIPRRSLLVIVDDRKRKEFYETHFIPILKEYGWKITNAWISAKDTPELYWTENQEVVKAGWVDVQAHGVVHNINISEYSDDEFIKGELYGSIEAIQKYHGTTPVAFIWPGGNFTKHAIELAREAGYRLGFTTNPRGPIMYNWIPQAEKVDPAHPVWVPEIPAGDARMTLPRYWSIDAAYRIDDVIAIGDEAAAAAEQTRAVELEYYDIVCKPRTGEIPALQNVP
jgi:peptidoglycan/xylan/chitin deacetylase (PgdA/CDA1 family)